MSIEIITLRSGTPTQLSLFVVSGDEQTQGILGKGGGGALDGTEFPFLWVE